MRLFNQDHQSENSEIPIEIMDSEIKKIINTISISKSRINNNLCPMSQKNDILNNQLQKKITESTFQF